MSFQPLATGHTKDLNHGLSFSYVWQAELNWSITVLLFEHTQQTSWLGSSHWIHTHQKKRYHCNPQLKGNLMVPLFPWKCIESLSQRPGPWVTVSANQKTGFELCGDRNGWERKEKKKTCCPKTNEKNSGVFLSEQKAERKLIDSKTETWLSFDRQSQTPKNGASSEMDGKWRSEKKRHFDFIFFFLISFKTFSISFSFSIPHVFHIPPKGCENHGQLVQEGSQSHPFPNQ